MRKKKEIGLEEMTLKDFIAIFAMQALIWNPDIDLENKEDVAEVAYGYANVMLEKKNGN